MLIMVLVGCCWDGDCDWANCVWLEDVVDDDDELDQIIGSLALETIS